MNYKKYKLGELIEPLVEKNSSNEYGIKDVRGISNAKRFINTKANLNGVSLKPYLIVRPNEFAYVTITSRNGDKISIAYNDGKETYLVSSSYIVFRIKDEEKLLPKYLYMFFNRPEFDRYCRYNSWGSARESFSWSDMCNISINLPSTEIQEKYVDLYESIVQNLNKYENGQNELKFVCDAYIEKLRKTHPLKKIGPYIKEIDERNTGDKVKLLQGFCMDGSFINPRRTAANTSTLKILYDGNLIYNKATECISDRFIIAQRNGPTCAVSNSYVIFKSIDENKLLNRYIYIWLCRKEFARYSRFISHGTTHEYFDFEDMCNVEIPIPDIEIQKSIVNIFDSLDERRNISNKIKEAMNNLGSILIDGSIKEGVKNE